MKRSFIFILFFSCSMLLLASKYNFEVKIIPLKALDYVTVEEFCSPMLSKEGKMVYLKDRRAVLVNDKPKVIAKIVEFISQVDTPRKNIKIKVEFLGSGGLSTKSFGVKSKDPWGIVIKDGEVDLPHIDSVHAEKKKSYSVRNNTMELVTISGSSATLYVGEEIPDVVLLESYLLNPHIKLKYHGRPYRYTRVKYERRFVGASLQMRPTLLASGLIMVELYPEVTYLNDKKKPIRIEIESLKTKVLVQPNQRINIGGNIKKLKGGYTNIFGPDFFKDEDGQKILKMYLTAQEL